MFERENCRFDRPSVIKSIDKDFFLRKFDCEISSMNLREI